MAIISDALRQAFMPKHEYQSLREEDKAWVKLQRPVLTCIFAAICIAILVSVYVCLSILFSRDTLKRPFCGDQRLQPITTNLNGGGDVIPGAFYLTNQEALDYYWMVVFIPSTIIFVASVVYLVAGVTVAYSTPRKHGCLKVVENNYCASKRGGVRCLSILNIVFAIIFGLLALFLGSSLLTFGSSCSMALFWCYEIAVWGLVVLYGGTAFILRRKTAGILDECDFSGRNLGLEMLEVNPLDVTPEVERRVNEGFKAWIGSSFLSSDEEDEPDEYQQVPRTTSNISSRQRV